MGYNGMYTQWNQAPCLAQLRRPQPEKEQPIFDEFVGLLHVMGDDSESSILVYPYHDAGQMAMRIICI